MVLMLTNSSCFTIEAFITGLDNNGIYYGSFSYSDSNADVHLNNNASAISKNVEYTTVGHNIIVLKRAKQLFKRDYDYS